MSRCHILKFNKCIVFCIGHPGMLIKKPQRTLVIHIDFISYKFCMLCKSLAKCKIFYKQQTSTQIQEICDYETFTFRWRAYSHLRKIERWNGRSGPHKTLNSFLLEMSMAILCVSVCSKYKEKRELNCRANTVWIILDPSDFWGSLQ